MERERERESERERERTHLFLGSGLNFLAVGVLPRSSSTGTTVLDKEVRGTDFDSAHCDIERELRERERERVVLGWLKRVGRERGRERERERDF